MRTIALAGLGAVARKIHLPALAKLRGLVEIVGGYDPAPSGRFPFPVHATLEELLAKRKPDILAVLAPPETHFDLTRKGLEAGCHVLCEKPFMTTLDQAETIVALARSAGRRVVVNNQYRFMRIFDESRRLIGSPRFGDLRFLSAHQTLMTETQHQPGWRGREGLRTCREFGIHVLDLCRFFFGCEPLTIFARMPGHTDAASPDLLDLIHLEFPGDRVAHITLDRTCLGPRRYFALRLNGTAGCLETSVGGHFEVRVGNRPGTKRPTLDVELSPGGRAILYHAETKQKVASDPLDIFAEATHRLLREFLGALDRGDVPPCDASDNSRTLALMLAAYESHQRGVPIPVVSERSNSHATNNNMDPKI